MTAEPAQKFNLVTDPWVSCHMLDGDIRELSLMDLFRDGASIRRLAGELPTQDYAILRILLAIAYSSMPAKIDDPLQYWQRLWIRPAEFIDPVVDYLQEWEDRFGLFDPSAPFMQVADLHTKSGNVDGVERLIADVPSGHQYFTTRAGAGLETLTYAEAARWLIHVHAYDPSGIKSGAIGDPRVKGGKGYPIGTGWAGGTGGMFFEGATIIETLMLNLDLGYAAREASHHDFPAWEQDPSGPAPRDATAPTGWVDVLTWQSRRVRLFPESGAVTGVLVSNGDALARQNMFADPMTAYRFSEPQTRKLKLDSVHMPREHDPDRTVWRGVAPLLTQRGNAPVDNKGHRLLLPSQTVEWIAGLRNEDILSDRVVNARLIGVVYGPQSSTFAEIIDDSLAVHVALMAETSRALAAVVIGAAEQTARAVWDLGTMAGELTRAAGGDPEMTRDAVRQSAYFDLDEPYRRWVNALDDTKNPDPAREEWNTTARRILRARATEQIEFAGPAAVIGRLADDGTFLTAAAAEGRFLYRLRRTLPLGAEHPEVTEVTEATEATDQDETHQEGAQHALQQ